MDSGFRVHVPATRLNKWMGMEGRSWCICPELKRVLRHCNSLSEGRPLSIFYSARSLVRSLVRSSSESHSQAGDCPSWANTTSARPFPFSLPPGPLSIKFISSKWQRMLSWKDTEEKLLQFALWRWWRMLERLKFSFQFCSIILLLIKSWLLINTLLLNGQWTVCLQLSFGVASLTHESETFPINISILRLLSLLI